MSKTQVFMVISAKNFCEKFIQKHSYFDAVDTTDIYSITKGIMQLLTDINDFEGETLSDNINSVMFMLHNLDIYMRCKNALSSFDEGDFKKKDFIWITNYLMGDNLEDETKWGQ